MRYILVRWLFGLKIHFNLLHETLFITVNIVDRYLMRRPITKLNFQCVGTAAIHIACKYQEIYPPSLAELVAMTRDAYTVEQVKAQEELILQVLEFNFTFPTSFSFLETFLQRYRQVHALQYELPVKLFAQYLLESSLCDMGIQRYKPSIIALAALYFTYHMMINTEPYK